MSGRLYIIATPIGNLSDLSNRVKDAFIASEFVLAEDTRVTRKLMYHLAVKKKLISCHQFNELRRTKLLEDLADRNLQACLVSDAGTPLVSDPGFQLVRRAIELGIEVVAIPGASAFLLALVGSGLPTDRFAFEGFLPKRTGDRGRRLANLKAEARTLVFYVTVRDLSSTLADMLATFGNRQACVARELTKMHEEFIRGTLESLLETASQRHLLGELVLVVGGAETGERTSVIPSDSTELMQELDERLKRGERLKDVAQLLARRVGCSASEIYKLGLHCRRRLPDQ